MQWTCQYKGCQSSPEQIAALRSRKPDGFEHDEDSSLRVCTVCRRRPLKEQSMDGKEEQLDATFIAGIKEELASIEENEKNIQALSQVFRYYSKHAKQLSQVLYDFAVKQCFPWEIIHAMYLVDDILLMDNSGRYKAELTERVQGIAVKAFNGVQTDRERKDIANMLQTWQELKIFERSVLEAIRQKIRGNSKISAAALKILEEVNLLAEEEAEEPALQAPEAAAAPPQLAGTKRKHEDAAAPSDSNAAALADARRQREAAANEKAAADAKATVVATALTKKVQATVDRINSATADKPFLILGMESEGADGAAIRKAYRRIALVIHPDKNPGMEQKCQEALIKLQSAREQAETELASRDIIKDSFSKGETRSAATAAKNEEEESMFKCKYPGCDLPPCKQCANGCCTRNITHCHMAARSKGGLQCFFHPPPRAWARNA